jgi:hypothetical protein
MLNCCISFFKKNNTEIIYSDNISNKIKHDVITANNTPELNDEQSEDHYNYNNKEKLKKDFINMNKQKIHGGTLYSNGILLWLNNKPHYIVKTELFDNNFNILIYYELFNNFDVKIGYYNDNNEFIDFVI